MRLILLFSIMDKKSQVLPSLLCIPSVELLVIFVQAFENNTALIVQRFVDVVKLI